MRNLIFFLVSYGGFLLFALLEVVSFYMVVNFNKKQNQIYAHSSSRVVGTVLEEFDDFTSYINLSTINDRLAKENAELLAQLKTSKYDNILQMDSIANDSILQQYTFVEARVINNSINNNNNSLTINRGSKHGIQSHSGVINSDGIVGIVREVSGSFARAASLLHRQTRISATIQRNNYFGSLVWTGQDPRYLSLQDVPKHADLILGDTIVTSGFSSMFPKGLLIGTIESFNLASGSNYYDIQVKLANNLSNIEYVYVVNNLMKEEQLELEEEVPNE